MKGTISGLIEELRLVVSGNKLDALLAPIIFVFFNNAVNLNLAIAISLALSILISVLRLVKKQTWQYALGGLAGVVIASGFAYLSGNAVNYFIPKIASSTFLLTLTIISIIIGKPLAAWASHFSRGWELKWFWRRDVKPAYTEVTILWAILFLFRLALFITVWQRGNLLELTWVNIILGLPFTIVILVLSYIYGIWRLRILGGPGVEEFRAGIEPPWKGQTRGF